MLIEYFTCLSAEKRQEILDNEFDIDSSDYLSSMEDAIQWGKESFEENEAFYAVKIEVNCDDSQVKSAIICSLFPPLYHSWDPAPVCRIVEEQLIERKI